jgi:hypothetical protein
VVRVIKEAVFPVLGVLGADFKPLLFGKLVVEGYASLDDKESGH